MENRKLRKRLAGAGTFFTFFGLLFVLLKELLEALTQTGLTPWGTYIGVACFVIAALSFGAVVYIDETYSYEDEHPRLLK